MACYWVRTTSLTNNISLLASALVFFVYYGVPEIDLGSLSMLSDACQRRNLGSWLEGNGLVREWMIRGWVGIGWSVSWGC